LVIMGTDVENKKMRIVSQFAEHFINTNALMLMCFRVDMASNTPFIIELHVDHGGDLLLDLMLPKAAKNFDYFEIAINISSNQEITGAKYVAIQKGTVFEDICRATQLVSNRGDLCGHLPVHKQWMEK
jgi:hypothetical protein